MSICLTRRSVLAASILAVSATLIGIAGIGIGQESEKQEISGREAKEEIDQRMKAILEVFEKRYGVKYTPSEKDRIVAETWESTRAALREKYTIVDP